MTKPASPTAGWGPDQKTGAFSVTFDNFGEAADIELGRHPADQAVGTHYTAHECLPTILKIVEQHPVTYFIEAINVARYPEQIKAIRDAGHEISMHAWQHENWGSRNPQQRQDILQRSLDAFETLGIRPGGFRPPGGVMPPGSLQEFHDAGLSYCSPLGEAGASGIDQKIAVLPFAWKHVDAYMLDPGLGALRTRFGDPAAAVDESVWQDSLTAAMQTALTQKTHVTVIFHPFLFVRAPRMTQVLESLLADLQSQTDLWVAPCAQVADWLKHSQSPAPAQ